MLRKSITQSLQTELHYSTFNNLTTEIDLVTVKYFFVSTQLHISRNGDDITFQF